MANDVVMTGPRLVYGICLPIAVLIGYMLADPMESDSLAVLVLVTCVLLIPLMMRWHHPLLIFSCNAAMAPYFLPGRPPLWMMVSVVSLFFAMLNRSVNREMNFFRARSVTQSLFFFGTVVLVTAYMTGGIGFRAADSATFGGKKYVAIFLSIALFLALSTQNISRDRVKFYVSLFYLSALTGLIGYLAILGGQAFNFLVELFPIDSVFSEFAAGSSVAGGDMMRLGGMASVASGLFCFLLASYGVRGVLDIKKPWRLMLFMIAIAANLMGGFRSQAAYFGSVFVLLFLMEGLLHTRYTLIVILAIGAVVAVLIPNAQRLPLSMQRALSFLPISVDADARLNAEGSTGWRVEMWKELMPEIPSHLLVGKGFGMAANDLFMTVESERRGLASDYETAMLAGDYHNGPLSLILIFGLFGVFGFTWFLCASYRVLLQNYRHGEPYLRIINNFLLTTFVVRIIFFLTIFGSIYSDVLHFAAIVGLSLSLNHGVRDSASSQTGDSTV